MSHVRGKDTKPEVALRKAVWALRGRYRTHPKDVPGRPDLANKARRVAVFVDGCFWHGCPDHFKLPKTRRLFWKEKIRRNQEKREEVLEELGDDWTVFQFYECELKENLIDFAEDVAAELL